jgi:hypothetical protein
LAIGNYNFIQAVPLVRALPQYAPAMVAELSIESKAASKPVL